MVLKQTQNHPEAEWCARVLSEIPQEGFELPPPILVEGHAVFENWVGFGFVKGETLFKSHFEQRIEASKAFHRALRGIDRQSFLNDRTDPWAVADRVTWEPQDWNPHPSVSPTLDLLRSLQSEAPRQCQVIHGDITGNMIGSPTGCPAIIDFTPYWSPSGFGEAIFAVDAVQWEGADMKTILRLISVDPEFLRLVARAAIRRLLEFDCQHRCGLRTSLTDSDILPHRNFAIQLEKLIRS